MKKSFVFAFLCVLALALVVSCAEPEAEVKSYTVTFDSNGGSEVAAVVVKEGEKVSKPENPTKDGCVFGAWQLDGKDFDFSSVITADTKLVASWIEIKHVKNLSEIKTVDGKTASFGFGSSSNEAVVIDGKGLYVVDEWQDLWVSHNVTLKNIIFADGVSIHSENTEEITLTIEGCTVYACDQVSLFEAHKDEASFRGDNSGDGLCLGIDTDTEGNARTEKTVNVVVKDSTFIGANDPESDRDGYKDCDQYKASNKNKSRGHGVSLGNQAGKTDCLKSAVIENCVFTGLKGHAVQLFKIDSPITIKNNKFESYGVNKQTIAGEKQDYAVRGDMRTKGSSVVLTFSGNTYEKSDYTVNISDYTYTGESK